MPVAPPCADDDHFVQFFESDEYLENSVSEYIGGGLHDGAAGIVVATKEHLRAIRAQLQDRFGIDVASLEGKDQLILLDARETLDRLLVDGHPSPDKFERIVVPLMAKISAKYPKVRAYGEMVGLLWEKGNLLGTITLENLWNALAKRYALGLYCGYSVKAFSEPGDATAFQEICRTHTQVLPSKDFLALDRKDQLRAVAYLEQQARSLRFELEQRKRADRALLGANEKLLASEAFRNAIMDNSQDCIKILDPNARLLFINAGGVTVLGLNEASDVLGSVWMDFWFGEDRPRAVAAFEKAKAGTGTHFTGCFPPAHKAGTKWWNVMLSPIRDKAGAVTSILAVSRDVTESKLAQREIEQSVATLKTLNELGQTISAELELDKLVQKVTDVATELTGAKFGALFYSLKNADGESYTLYTLSGVPRAAFEQFPMPRKTQIFAPTFDGVGVMRIDDVTKDTRYGHSGPYFGMPEGHLPVKSYLAVPVISRSREVIGGLFFGHPDAGVFTEKEEDLVKGLAAQAATAIDNARLYQKSLDAVRARDTFLSIASHELKTPLTSLSLQAQMRKRAIDKGDFQRFAPDKLPGLLAEDEKQIKRVTRLVDDLLDIARLQTGKLRLERETFELRNLVHELLERFSPMIQAAGSTVSLEGSAVTGSWDRFRMEQVITNLLTNAIKYGAGSRIEIEVKGRGDSALLSVRDYGNGIAKEDQARIFDQFERVASASGIAGFGLGLYIIKQLVVAHGGKISVDSDLGRGSTFTIELPRHALI